MLLSHLARVIARRWVIVAAGLLATLGLTAAAVMVVPPEYSLTATVLLVPPVDTAAPGANPYLSLGGLTAPTEVLARAMVNPGTEKALRDAGATGTWTVERDYLTSAPILVVTTQDASVAQAQRTATVVLKAIPTQLQALQAAVNVSPSAMITSSVVNRDADQQQVLKPLIRVLMLILIAGLVLTVATASLVDSVASRRAEPEARSRREGRGRRGRQEPAGGAPDDTSDNLDDLDNLGDADAPEDTRHRTPDVGLSRAARRRRSLPSAPVARQGSTTRRSADDPVAGGELLQTGHGHPRG